MKLKEELTTAEMLALKTFKDLIKEEIKQEVISELKHAIKQETHKPIETQGEGINAQEMHQNEAVEYEPQTEEEKKEYRLFINDIKREVEQNGKTNQDVVLALGDFINNILEKQTDKPTSKMIEPEKRADFLEFLKKRFKS